MLDTNVSDGPTVTMNLGKYECAIQAVNWNRFDGLVMLTEKAKSEFLSNILNDMLKELLYNNPELFNSYVRHD